MDFLNVIIGFSLAIWVLIGIRMHASWIAGTFLSEIDKIDFQQYRIEKYGYESISVAKSLKPQRVLVYGYWGEPEESLDGQEQPKRSPIIFSLVNASLISFTSISILIVLSKGLFNGIGISWAML